MRIYGPYTRKDGRQHVIIIDDNDSRRTVSYPKWIMEQHLGRELDPNKETIDHIDGDFTNNDLSNLRVISRSKHAKDDAVRVKLISTQCIWCGELITREPRQIRRASKLNMAGPFCGKSCSGKYGKMIQMNKIDRIDPQDCPESEYYKIDKII